MRLLPEPFIPVPESIATRTDISSSAKLLAGAILRMQQRDGAGARSQRGLAEDLGLSPRSIRAAMLELKHNELLEVIPGGRNKASSYRLSDGRTARNNAQRVGRLARNTARNSAHKVGGIARTGGGNNAQHCASLRAHIEEKEERVRGGALLEEFLHCYPKKTHQHLTAQLWLSIVAEEDERKVLEGLDRWKASAEWSKDGGKYIPRPDRWIIERRWLDFPQQSSEVERTPDFDAEVA